MVFRLTPRPVATAIAALSAASLLAACATEDEPLSEQAVGLPVDAPQVTLEEPGQTPREVLTYDDIDGDDQDVTVTVTDGFTQSVVAEADLDPAAPAGTVGGGGQIGLPLSGDTSEASDPDEGQREATRAPEYRVGAATIDDQNQLSELRTAEGFRLGWRGDDAGQVSTLMLSAPEEASDVGRAMTEGAIMDLMAMPVVFPAEEIGVGATWSVESRVAGDASVLRTTTYTLESREGDIVELGVEIDERPSLGALSLEGIDGADAVGETQLDVDSSDTSSSGSLTVDLNHALPVDGEVAHTTRVVYRGETEQLIVQDTSTSLRFDAAEATE